MIHNGSVSINFPRLVKNSGFVHLLCKSPIPSRINHLNIGRNDTFDDTFHVLVIGDDDTGANQIQDVLGDVPQGTHIQIHVKLPE